MTDLLIATNNPGKLAEFRRLLTTLPVRLVDPAQIGLSLTVPEPHLVYAENAAAKAEAFCRACGKLTLADDSGIEVVALNGGPGPRSARLGSDAHDPVDVLLDRLAGVTDRRARMVCWLALAIPRGQDRVDISLFEGTVDGSVAAERRGRGGFGYDPVFLLPEGVTSAELSDAEKDARSHRGRAVSAALPRLREVVTATRLT